MKFKPPLFIAAIVWLMFISVTNSHPDTRADLAFIRSSRGEQEPEGISDKSRLDLKDRTDELEMAGLTALRLYQLFISSQDGPRCMFYPSCSEYAKLALAEHGIFVGSLMAIDRFLRCNRCDDRQRILQSYIDPALCRSPLPRAGLSACRLRV